MDIFIGIIVGLFVLMFLVTAHEFGHFLAARRNGVRVVEFGICFPPRAVAWIKDPKTGKWRRLKRSEWEKSKVTKTVGVEGKDASTKAVSDGSSKELFETRKGTFGAAKYWAKTKILFAGVAMNWLVAFIIFTILAWTGMPEFLDGQFTIDADTRREAVPVQITSVAEESPAERAGLKKGDYILAVDGQEVKYASEVTDINKQHAGDTVHYTIQRNSETDTNCDCDDPLDCPCLQSADNGGQIDIVAQLNSADAEYLLGVTMTSTQAKSYSTWSAPVVGAGLTLQLTGETFKGVGVMLGNLVSGAARLFSFDDSVRESGQEALSEVKDSVTGPVGIIGVLFPSFTSAGPTNLAFLAALISVSLACMNILPIPALDGGRWLLITIYKLRKKKLTKETEEKIVSRAFMVLLALIFIVTILDVVRMVSR